MTRIVICGGPRTGKTTLGNAMYEAHDWPHEQPDCDGCGTLMLADSLVPMGWSGASQYIAEQWLTRPGPWIIEGVAVSRALRKWREAHPGEPPPVDRVIRLTTPHVDLTRGQAAMAKGEETVWAEVEPWLREHGVEIEER